MSKGLYILVRFSSTDEALYVDYVKPLKKQVPVTTGNDWGYVTDVSKALPVSEFHMRRFMNDAQYCRFHAKAVPYN